MGIQGAESGKENLWTVDQTSKLTPVGLLAHLWTWGGGGSSHRLCSLFHSANT